MKREDLADGIEQLISHLKELPTEELVSGLKKFKEIDANRGFKKNTAGDRTRYLEAWNHPDAVEERASLFMGWRRCPEATNILHVVQTAESALGTVDGLVRVSGIKDQEGDPPSRGAELETVCTKTLERASLEIGSVVLEWLEHRNGRAIRKLADAVEQVGRSESEWKHRILHQFLKLCEAENFAVLPTKSQVRRAVDLIPTAGEFIDDSDFRKAMKALGLSGLPHDKPGPKKK